MGEKKVYRLSRRCFAAAALRILCQPDMGVIKRCLVMAILKKRSILIFLATWWPGQSSDKAAEQLQR